MPSEWVCVQMDATNTECTVTQTVDMPGYNGPSFHEWLFVAGVFLFFLSWLTWGKISFTKE